MRRDYELARKLANKAVKKARKNNTSPYLPVLDTKYDSKSFFREVRAGLMELPVNRIVGTKELSRTNAFAGNFMPLHGVDSEFAYKWSDLHDAVSSCGIRDAIKVYEFMHEYYVQEGNKRVSVSKYYKIDFILAEVIRILPYRDGSDEVEAYYEYLDFYNVTKNYYLAFKKVGSYRKLAELLGQNLTEQWNEDLLIDLKAAYFQFIKIFKAVTKMQNDFSICDAFLTYVEKFTLESLLTDSDRKIKENIRINKNELMGIETETTETAVRPEKTFGIRGMLNGFRNTLSQNSLEFSE
ncbi:MAG: hypothetical protein IJA12_00500 [Oscillospiraceae bacterium]|nr:hypothetical protein [Oscillospiraceae bacterium]